MLNKIKIKDKILPFNKSIRVSGDKSISIRWVLLSSLANGISKSKNLLMSEDVFAAINCIRKFGIKVIFTNGVCKIFGKGINGYKYKKNIVINAMNSGTLGRLILGFLIPLCKISIFLLAFRHLLIAFELPIDPHFLHH